jgi:hypothetical protein
MTETKFKPEQFYNLIQMGSSINIEDRTLALMLVESVDLKEHLVYVLLFKKLCKIDDKLWIEHAPKTYRKLKSIVDLQRTITYKTIFEMLGKYKVNIEQMQFFLEYFSKYLAEQCKSLGYDFIDELEIKIKTKALNDKSGNAS